MPITSVDPSGAVTRSADETPTGDLATPSFVAAGADQIGRAVQAGYLRTPDHDPVVPARIQARLRALSPRLGLVFDQELGAFKLLDTWGDDDPRRATIGSAHPYTILAMCHPSVIGVDEIPTWVEQRLVLAAGGGNDRIRTLLAEEEAAAERQRAARAQEIRDLGRQAVADALTSATDVTAARHGKRRTRHEVTPA